MISWTWLNTTWILFIFHGIDQIQSYTEGLELRIWTLCSADWKTTKRWLQRVDIWERMDKSRNQYDFISLCLSLQPSPSHHTWKQKLSITFSLLWTNCCEIFLSRKTQITLELQHAFPWARLSSLWQHPLPWCPPHQVGHTCSTQKPTAPQSWSDTQCVANHSQHLLPNSPQDSSPWYMLQGNCGQMDGIKLYSISRDLYKHGQRLNHDQVCVVVTRGGIVAIECLLLWIRQFR